jgi:hypothetical protein
MYLDSGDIHRLIDYIQMCSEYESDVHIEIIQQPSPPPQPVTRRSSLEQKPLQPANPKKKQEPDIQAVKEDVRSTQSSKHSTSITAMNHQSVVTDHSNAQIPPVHSYSQKYVQQPPETYTNGYIPQHYQSYTNPNYITAPQIISMATTIPMHQAYPQQIPLQPQYGVQQTFPGYPIPNWNAIPHAQLSLPQQQQSHPLQQQQQQVYITDPLAEERMKNMEKEMEALQQKVQTMHKYLRKLSKKEKLSAEQKKEKEKQKYKHLYPSFFHVSDTNCSDDEEPDYTFFAHLDIQTMIRKALVIESTIHARAQRSAATIIQRHWRIYRKNKHFPEIRQLQRKCKLYEVVIHEQKCAIQVDRVTIRYLWQQVQDLRHSNNNHDSLYEHSATVIQKYWRGYRHRRLYRQLRRNYHLFKFKLLYSILKIQYCYRKYRIYNNSGIGGEVHQIQQQQESVLDISEIYNNIHNSNNTFEDEEENDNSSIDDFNFDENSESSDDSDSYEE